MRTRLAFTLALAIAAGCSPADEAPVLVIDAATAIDLGRPDAAPPADDAGRDMRDASDGGDTVPQPPAQLTHWVTGNDDDVDVDPAGPGLILMGGGGEPDEAFHWWRPLVAGGDVVVIRVSGADGYNDYLYGDIGGVDSVETLKVDSAALADDPYVAWRVDHAEAVFIAGGNQWDYLSLWRGTALQAALQRVHGRGAVLGGTSAGLAVLGDRAFSAENDSVYSEEALADPFDPRMRFADDFIDLQPLSDVVTDSHFRERDRMGRLVAFVARMWVDGFAQPTGIGVDESTALVIGPEGREVVGRGAVYEVTSAAAPQRCEPGQPLEFRDVRVTRTTALESQSYVISAAAGALEPADPYTP